MPRDNRFRHQQYTDAVPAAPFEIVASPAQPNTGSAEFAARMQGAGDLLRAHGITTIYLVHGTFVGGDAIGLWSNVGRLFPSLGDTLEQWTKQRVDSLLGERGNYTQQYAELFERSIHREGAPHIAVRLFRWSSQNHHIGRADGAVRLLDDLVREARGGRILLWGHSHAGNVFALLTHLLAADPASIRAFFDAARPFYRRPIIGTVDVPVWESMRTLLERERRPLGDTRLAIVTFGTPIRYGWESAGYDSLLHFVHHKPRDGRPPYLASFPPTVETIRDAAGGDFVQHFGIAGTNAPPGVFDFRALLADGKLNALLQGDLTVRDLLKRLAPGMRVPSEGRTLLVDYGPVGSNPVEHHAGHAVYTKSDWLLFHCEQVANHLARDGSPRSVTP